MKIAYLHYHLNPGGVTTVIRQQIRTIGGDCAVMALAGEQPNDFPAKVAVIPGIAYDQPGRPEAPPDKTAAQIQKAIQAVWPEGCDILHVHNPTLAKNRRLPAVLKILQQSGIRLLLQIHDFAEDGRPNAYFKDPYPADCHYCVINTRDLRLLEDTGLKPQGLHYLPNMVTPVALQHGDCGLDNFVLYPVRAIRRKNIGEAILMAACFQNNETLAITLPPNSPMDLAAYDGWRRFCSDHHLKVVLEASLSHDFAGLVTRARYLITTSINEGFGFSFLEPWTAEKILCGRCIDDICTDFTQAGIQLDHLYSKIKVPLNWLDQRKLFQVFQETLLHSAAQFHAAAAAIDPEAGFMQFTDGDTVDFGLLSEAFQQQILSRVVSSRSAMSQLMDLNPSLADPTGAVDARIIANNNAAVRNHFSLERYRKRLIAIYEAARTRPVRHAIDKQKLLEFFLTPARLHLLKWCAYEPNQTV